MQRKTKDRILDGGFMLIATAPFWLTTLFAVANIHGEVMVDSEGHVIKGLITRDEYSQKGVFSFSKRGEISVSPVFATYNIYHISKEGRLRAFYGVVFPRMGMVMGAEKTAPTSAEIAFARHRHAIACDVIKQYGLTGYERMNCPSFSR